MFTQHQLQQLAAEVAHILQNQAGTEPATMMIANNGEESPETRRAIDLSRKLGAIIIEECPTETEQFNVISHLRNAMSEHWQNERHVCHGTAETSQRRAERLSDFIKETCV